MTGELVASWGTWEYSPQTRAALQMQATRVQTTFNSQSVALGVREHRSRIGSHRQPPVPAALNACTPPATAQKLPLLDPVRAENHDILLDRIRIRCTLRPFRPWRADLRDRRKLG